MQLHQSIHLIQYLNAPLLFFQKKNVQIALDRNDINSKIY